MNAEPRPFQFAPAVREKVSLLIALAGASGSGKTMSALRLAKGMAPSGKIAFIDTEARRGLHYADQFRFMHADMHPPFTPQAFVDGIRAAEKAGAEVIIIDSFSHEYDGPGGIMDMADAFAEQGVKSPGNWKEPKAAHKKLMQALLQCRASLIFCLRADEKIEILREGGRTVVRPLGWMPICEKRFMFEMTASFTLTPDNPGKPNFNLPHKCQEQHRAMFPAGQFISEDSGRVLAEWARGGVLEPQQRQADQGADDPAPSREALPTEAESGAGPYVPEVTWDEYVSAWEPRLQEDGVTGRSLVELWNSDAHKEMRRQAGPTKEQIDALLNRVVRRRDQLNRPKQGA